MAELIEPGDGHPHGGGPAEGSAGIRDRFRNQIRSEVKQVGLRQLAEGGPQALSVNAIAKELGVSGPALYRYFASRDALLTELVLDAYHDMAAAVADASSPERQLARPERLRAVAAAYRAWANAQPHRYRLLFAAPIPGFDPQAEGLVRAAQEAMNVLLEILMPVPSSDWTVRASDSTVRPSESPVLASESSALAGESKAATRPAALARPKISARPKPSALPEASAPPKAPVRPDGANGGDRAAVDIGQTTLDGQLEHWLISRQAIDASPAVALQSILAWSRLHGLVSLEIEGTFASMGIDPQLLFDAEVRFVLDLLVD